jgi:hypothetical protein
VNPREIEQIGPYSVRRFIAEGGMAWVFEVTDPEAFDAPRALKMLKPGMSEDIFRRFKEEAGMLTRLDHPNLITIHKFGFDEATRCHYYTMTLVTGGHLGGRGVIPLEDAKDIFIGVLGGLARLHENNIIHRDIKPSNIFLGPDGWPKLGDLGIARTADVSEGDTWYASTHAGKGATSTGIAIGTPAYMSPEQARGSRDIGKPTDVFSFGLTMYAVLTGHSIYDEIPEVDSTSGMDILAYLGHLRIARGEFEFQFDSEAPIPPSVQDVIRNACSIDAADRYPDAQAMLRDLRQALANPDDSTGERSARGQRARRGPRQSWLPRVAAAGVLLASIGGGWWAWTKWPGGPDAAGLTRESVSELERVVTRVLETAAAAQPATPPELLAGARKRHGAALTLLELSASKPDFVADSHAQFLEACQILVTGDLHARFEGGTAEARRVADGLGELQVKQLAADDWSRLEQQLVGLIPPEADAPACAKAVQLQAEIGETELALRTGREIEKKLEREWPRLAGAARNEALHAESGLAQIELDSPAYQAALAQAREAFAAGDTAVADRSYLAARDHFWTAKDLFARAETVAGAAQAGAKAREAMARAAALDIHDAAIEAQVSRANDLLQEGRFGDAKDAYEQATRFLDVSVGEATQSAGARQAREVADRAHEDARKAGADRSAAAAIAAADADYAAATRAFEEKSFEEAERSYGAAAKAYAAARTNAVAEVDRARKEGQAARAAAKELAKVESCSTLSAAARATCEVAHQSIADADAAVTAGDAATAVALFSRASESFEEAREIVRAEIENQPKPPTITSRKPVADQVTAAKGESVRFEVQARDPNAKDSLRYAWTVDGVTQDEIGPKLDVLAGGAKTARIEVRVDDGTGLEASAGWSMTVKNRPPTVSLKPATTVLKIKPGENVPFAAQASDADGEAVELTYLVAGRRVADGSAYVFKGTKEGRFVVEVLAKDASGGETRVKRTVEVASPNEPPVISLTTDPPSLEIDENGSITFRASAKDPEAEPVRFAFYVDGRKVSDGSTYTLSGRPAGSHVVEARATDAAGATTSSRRTVRVAKVEPVPPPEPAKAPEVVQPEPEPAPVAEEKIVAAIEKPEAPRSVEEPPSPAASGDAYVKQISQTMSLYKQYLQARDVGSLSGVWVMSPMDKLDLRTLFQACAAGKFEVSLRLGKPALKGNAGNQATISFNETLKCNGGVVRNEARIANLVLRGTDEWQIRTMQTP